MHMDGPELTAFLISIRQNMVFSISMRSPRFYSISKNAVLNVIFNSTWHRLLTERDVGSESFVWGTWRQIYSINTESVGQVLRCSSSYCSIAVQSKTVSPKNSYSICIQCIAEYAFLSYKIRREYIDCGCAFFRVFFSIYNWYHAVSSIHWKKITW